MNKLRLAFWLKDKRAQKPQFRETRMKRAAQLTVTFRFLRIRSTCCGCDLLGMRQWHLDQRRHKVGKLRKRTEQLTEDENASALQGVWSVFSPARKNAVYPSMDAGFPLALTPKRVRFPKQASVEYA